MFLAKKSTQNKENMTNFALYLAILIFILYSIFLFQCIFNFKKYSKENWFNFLAGAICSQCLSLLIKFFIL